HFLSSPAYCLLWRPDADDRSELPGTVDDRLFQGAGTVPRADEVGYRAIADGRHEAGSAHEGDRGTDSPEHRAVPECHAHVHAIPASHDAGSAGGYGKERRARE